VSSRAKKKADAKAQASAEQPRPGAPASVSIALGCLAAFVAMRATDLQLTWGQTPMFVGALATIAITAVFAVGVARGDRFAWQAARWLGSLLTLALIAGALFGYPAPPLRLYAMAVALAGMVFALSVRSARAYYEHPR
jgi:hypothetical protein